MHSLRPEKVGADVSSVQVPNEVPGAPMTVGEIAREGGEWSGENTNFSGQKQVVSYVYSKGLRGLIAIHIPSKVIDREVARVALPLALTLSAAVLVLIPASMLSIFFLLRRTEKDYIELYNNSPCMYVSADSAGSIISCNDTFLTQVGHTLTELIGRPLEQLYASSSHTSASEVLGKYQRTGSVSDAQLSLLCKDGRVLETLVSMAQQRDEHGHTGCSRSALVDITEFKHLQESAFRNQKLESLGSLAAGVAHDFNNCLLTITLNTELAWPLAPRDAQRHLEDVLSSTKNAKELVQSLLSFSSGVKPKRTPVHLLEALQEVERIARRLLPESIVISSDLHAMHEVWIKASPYQLQQALLNLLLNARDAMPHGGTIQLSAERQEDRAKLTIKDTGAGIAPDDLEHIFQPFFSTKKPGKGTGLGLSMASSFVKDHGGTISASSVMGQGSTFEVLLPYQPTQPKWTGGPERLAALAIEKPAAGG